MIKIHTGQAPRPLGRAAFHERFMQSYRDPAYKAESEAIARLESIAWEAYTEGRKAALTRKAGKGFADPTYELSVSLTLPATTRWTPTRTCRKKCATWRAPSQQP